MADAEERDGGNDLGDLLNHVSAIDSRGRRWSQSKWGRGLARWMNFRFYDRVAVGLGNSRLAGAVQQRYYHGQ